MVKHMKGKIIGLIISMLFICSIVGATTPNVQTGQVPTSLDDDVPIWNVGDSWTYTIDDFTVDYNQGGQIIFIDGRIDDFTWVVESTAGSSYQVSFSGEIACEYEIYLTSATANLYVTGNMVNTLTKFTGTIVFSKADLQIQDINGEIKGLSFGKISPLPIPLPLLFRISVDGDLSNDFPLFDFPLYVLKTWALPEIQATMQVQIGGYFGLIKIPMTFYVNYPYTPLAFWVTDKRDITVEAGIYNAYQIESGFFDLFEYYYAPTVGNMIKIDAMLTNGDMHGELKSFNWP